MYAFIVIFIFIIIAMVVGATMYEIYLTYVQDKQGYAQARHDAQYTLLAMRARDIVMVDMDKVEIVFPTDDPATYTAHHAHVKGVHVDMYI